MNRYALNFKEIETAELKELGGKGLNLVNLSKIEGIDVPRGFCITTSAFEKTILNDKRIPDLIDELPALEEPNVEAVCSSLRHLIEEVTIPSFIEEEILTKVSELGSDCSVAVRSSATAEDLPSASFAGQHDTFLNISGSDEIIKHIKKCWASLYSERAVLYRNQNQFDHKKVLLSVVIQPMIFPRASGIMFTADPISSNRKILSIDAGLGLGEALVSGLISGDNYKVKENVIIKKTIQSQKVLIAPSDKGGIEEKAVNSSEGEKQTLTDEEILKLENLGRNIERAFGSPQDIEWSLLDNQFYILQSRPITTLYPKPQLATDEKHIFISSGHLQMMTDPIKPLGMFFFEAISGEAANCQIGGRSYCDITHDISSPMGRKMAVNFIKLIGDELMTSAVKEIAGNRDFLKSLPKGKNKTFKPQVEGGIPTMFREGWRVYRENNPDNISKLIRRNEQSLLELQEKIDRLEGKELLDFIYKDQKNLRKNVVYPECSGALIAALLPMMWFNKKVEKWLGEKNASDRIIQSVPNSITTDTGLGLMDVADVVRNHPAVIEYFSHFPKEGFLKDLSLLEGGKEVREALQKYLNKYGARCTGDIDITRPRWIEDPTALIPIILNNIKNFQPGAKERVLKEGRLESEQVIEELISRVEQLRGGRRKAKRLRKVASVIRNHIGFREYPKFAYMQRYILYKNAMLKEAQKLVTQNIIEEKNDIYYMFFDELKEAVQGKALNKELIFQRKEEYKYFEKLTPPRVITSEGEVLSGQYANKELPETALPGLPVSAGIVEGRARVIMSLDQVDMEEGDILVTPFTDPSWTPVFASVKGLVTEVGGVATHGAIIAREYGLPAVVSVENATTRIEEGQRIRVDGTRGFVEVL